MIGIDAQLRPQASIHPASQTGTAQYTGQPYGYAVLANRPTLLQTLKSIPGSLLHQRQHREIQSDAQMLSQHEHFIKYKIPAASFNNDQRSTTEKAQPCSVMATANLLGKHDTTKSYYPLYISDIAEGCREQW
jgi:hypothetical protein